MIAYPIVIVIARLCYSRRPLLTGALFTALAALTLAAWATDGITGSSKGILFSA
jgi:hypothetical protein